MAAAGNGVVWIYVANSRLFRSFDRGETWEERTAPADVFNVNVAFVDDRNGWLLTAGSPAIGCMAQDFEIWRTTDGAATWQNVYKDDLSLSAVGVAGTAAAVEGGAALNVALGPDGTAAHAEPNRANTVNQRRTVVNYPGPLRCRHLLCR